MGLAGQTYHSVSVQAPVSTAAAPRALGQKNREMTEESQGPVSTPVCLVIAPWREALVPYTEPRDGLCVPLPGLPQESVKDNHSLRGASGALGEGTEYTQAADVRDTT